MTDKRTFIKNALLAAVPVAISSRIMASPIEDKIIAIQKAEIDRLKKMRPGLDTGEKIPAGYVGQIISSISERNEINMLNNSTFYDVCSIAISAGVWNVMASTCVERNGATVTSADYVALASTRPGHDGVNARFNLNYVNQNGVANPDFHRFHVSLNFVLRCDGQNCILADGTAMAGTTLYLKAYSGVCTAGNIRGGGSITAVRIA